MKLKPRHITKAAAWVARLPHDYVPVGTYPGQTYVTSEASIRWLTRAEGLVTVSGTFLTL